MNKITVLKHVENTSVKTPGSYNVPSLADLWIDNQRNHTINHDKASLADHLA